MWVDVRGRERGINTHACVWEEMRQVQHSASCIVFCVYQIEKERVRVRYVGGCKG